MRIMDINYHGCVRLVRAVAPAMMAAGRGLVVNMGSASAYTGGGGQVPGALSGWVGEWVGTQRLALAYHVCCMCHPMGAVRGQLLGDLLQQKEGPPCTLCKCQGEVLVGGNAAGARIILAPDSSCHLLPFPFILCHPCPAHRPALLRPLQRQQGSPAQPVGRAAQ